MSKYYYLVAGLPELTLEDSKLSYTVADFKSELYSALSEEDRMLIDLFYLQFDNANVLKLLKDKDAAIDPRGNYSAEELAEYISLLKEGGEVSEFNTDRYRKLKYISWVYDCPVNIRRTAALKNDCNIIYFFDRIQAESYAKQGVRGAGHMPLAVDTDIFAEAINNAFGNVVNNVTNNVGNSCISDVAVNERAEFKDTGILQESILCNITILKIVRQLFLKLTIIIPVFHVIVKHIIAYIHLL